ncbi:Organic solute transporter subunit alpha/Transmembrane protein 184 [Trinorchestia longiramus]|nr:Organic solute transporter subunit alpha/Transmembrane protein 184 [Trinorchestia longiramus]
MATESMSKLSVEEENNSIISCSRPSYIPTVAEYNRALGGNGGIAFITIGSVLSVMLYALFFKQVYFTLIHTHKIYRRHIYWLISIYPLVTLMSTLAIIVPRAHEICSAVKITYMCIGVGHFVDLTILMFGSENKLAETVANRTLQLNVLPLCCCMPCLPKPKVSKVRLQITKWMIWQMKYTQALYYFCLVYVNLVQEDSEGYVRSRAPALILTVLNFISFLSGVFALNIVARLVDEDFSIYRYRLKALVLKILILTTKLQSFVFNVLVLYDVFPCVGEFITPPVYGNTVENWVLILEMLLFSFLSYFLYSKPEFKTSPVDVPNRPNDSTSLPQQPTGHSHATTLGVLDVGGLLTSGWGPAQGGQEAVV